MKINRHGSAVWQGGIKDGKGSISTESGALRATPMVFPAASRVCLVPIRRSCSGLHTPAASPWPSH